MVSIGIELNIEQQGRVLSTVKLVWDIAFSRLDEGVCVPLMVIEWLTNVFYLFLIENIYNQ